MSINEKIIFDYNIFYEGCLQAFNSNPVIVAQRLSIATELYDSLTDQSIKLSDFSQDDLMKLADMDNIFESFFSFWIKRQSKLSIFVEDVFAEMLLSA